MKQIMNTLAGMGLVLVSATSSEFALAHDDHQSGATIEQVKLANLMSTPLARTPGTEVIVSRVELPPNTTLPKHWHPGEEFAYVIEGSVTLWQKGKDEIVAGKGEVVKVPLKQVHTAITKDEGAVVLVFRVHEAGQPERVKVE